jgi:hypothetical protein
MRILLSESTDKQRHVFGEKTKDEVLAMIREDHNLHEVVDMHDPSKYVRVYFDIDAHVGKATLDDVLKVVCDYFQCTPADWAISDGCRETKISYHILSKKFRIRIQDLRVLAKELNKTLRVFDETVYVFTLTSPHEYGYLRFPNQSKDSINKPAPPMRVLQGDLSDFFVTDISGLEDFTRRPDTIS